MCGSRRSTGQVLPEWAQACPLIVSVIVSARRLPPVSTSVAANAVLNIGENDLVSRPCDNNTLTGGASAAARYLELSTVTRPWGPKE
jgi:hypothetical protein